MAEAIPALRECKGCGITKPLDDFYRHGRWWAHRCKRCQNKLARARAVELHTVEELNARQRRYNALRDPLAKLNNVLRHRYGMSVADWQALAESQENACAICSTELDALPAEPSGRARLHVDHSHEDGRVRGLLCNACNRSLGGFRDDITLLRRAVAYVEAGGVPLVQEHPEWRARA